MLCRVALLFFILFLEQKGIFFCSAAVKSAPERAHIEVTFLARTTTVMELVSVNKLIPYVNNARTHSAEQINKLRASLREFGFVNPVIIDQNNNVVAGHGRLIAAREEGFTEVPCVLVDYLTEAQRKAYILADNRYAEDAGWDEERLRIEIEALQEQEFDLSLTGFDSDELADLLLDDDPEAEDDDFDVDAAMEEKPFAKPGDLWIIGKHRLLCGDATKAEDVRRLMDGAMVDMVFTDPPWNVNYGSCREDNAQGYKPRKIMNDSMGTEEFKKFMCSAFQQMNAASKDGAMTYVVMSAQEWGNMMLTLAQNDYHWSSTIIWNKDTLVLSRKDYHTKYEPIWYGWKGGAARICPLRDRKQSDVWDFDRPKRSDEHPTMKPVPLVAQAITNSSKPMAAVLDLFGGSGTTLIACEQTNRTCYMMELDPQYASVIVRRYVENFGGADRVYVERDGEKIMYADLVKEALS